MSTEQYTALLKDAGLRVTAPRIATLAVVSDRPHADAEDIWAGVNARLGSVSRQAVYDVLRALSEANIVTRIHLDSRGARYELQRHDNHHHLICKACGKFEDVPCATGSAPCLTPHGEPDFTVEVAEVLYRGLCTQCAAEKTLTT